MDRGYTPKALLYPFPFNYLAIGMGVLKARKYMQNAGGNDTFKTETWSENILDRIAEMPNPVINIKGLGRKSLNDSLLMASRGRYLTYRHMASIKLFMNMVEK
jgi:hypothetical protein